MKVLRNTRGTARNEGAFRSAIPIPVVPNGASVGQVERPVAACGGIPGILQHHEEPSGAREGGFRDRRSGREIDMPASIVPHSPQARLSSAMRTPPRASSAGSLTMRVGPVRPNWIAASPRKQVGRV